MKYENNYLLLYAITNNSWLGNETMAEQVEKALKGGATCLQLREKELDEVDFLNEAIEIRELCNRYKVPFIINDNVDLAIKCKADGVHVGQSDMNASDVRKKIGNDMILGVSTKTVQQALFAQENGADYLGVGAVFSTSTKKDPEYITRDTLIEIANAVNIPIVAIGGINRENITTLKGTNISGVALVSAIFASKDIENECKILKEISKDMVKK
ncbi:MAG: thiamine phosphate synthase [Clostridia bacterium]